MDKYINLEHKIKAMSAKEIILAMVEGLRNPVTYIDMATFGTLERGVCYGCAATNTICRLGDFNPHEELSYHFTPKYARNSTFISLFESAIDLLRRGDNTGIGDYDGVEGYNSLAHRTGFAEIVLPVGLRLPEITDSNYRNPLILKAYIDLANAQE